MNRAGPGLSKAEGNKRHARHKPQEPVPQGPWRRQSDDLPQGRLPGRPRRPGGLCVMLRLTGIDFMPARAGTGLCPHHRPCPQEQRRARPCPQRRDRRGPHDRGAGKPPCHGTEACSYPPARFSAILDFPGRERLADDPRLRLSAKKCPNRAPERDASSRRDTAGWTP